MKLWKQRVIILFCLWHTAAVALFVLHVPRHQVFAQGVIQAKNITEPYVYGLTQWQYWNIFAPDPLQRSSAYRIEMLAGSGEWHTIHLLDYENLPWHKRAKELKILENIEENWLSITPAYLRGYCSSLGLQQGSVIRLVAASIVLPTQLQDLKHSAALEFPITERELGSTQCGA